MLVFILCSAEKHQRKILFHHLSAQTQLRLVLQGTFKVFLYSTQPQKPLQTSPQEALLQHSAPTRGTEPSGISVELYQCFMYFS